MYSPSIWAGWYRGLYTEYEAELKKQAALVPRFLHMEWGADSHARRHSETPDKVNAEIKTGTGADERGLDYLPTGGIPRVSVDGDWSETYACNLFDWHLKVQESQEWLTGAAQWIFKDFTTPLRAENPVPRINQKGVVGRDLDEEGVVLRLPVVLGGRADDSHLRAHVAGALGQGWRAEDGEGVLELRGGGAVPRREVTRE